MARFKAIARQGKDGQIVWYTPEQVRDMQDYRRSLPPKGPYIITDAMQALEHPCDGRIYDSKSEFRKVTRAHGFIETGGQLPPLKRDIGATLPPIEDYEKDVAQALEMVEQGWTPPPEMTVSQWERELGEELPAWTE